MSIPNDFLDTRITAALERPPAIRIPAGFAARVAAHAPARPTLQLTRAPRIGRLTALATMALLAVIMLLLVPQIRTGALIPTAIEYTFTLEFLALVLFFTLRPSPRR